MSSLLPLYSFAALTKAMQEAGTWATRANITRAHEINICLIILTCCKDEIHQMDTLLLFDLLVPLFILFGGFLIGVLI